MAGPVIIPTIVEWLAARAPKDFHYTHIANELKMDAVQVSNALNNRAAGKDPDIERVRRGVWRYIGTETPKEATPSITPGVPTLLEFIGKNRDDTMIYRDPDTMDLYRVERN